MEMIRNLVGRIRNWYLGKLIENEPDSMIVIFGMRRPFLAVKFDQSVAWVKTNWQFLIGTALAIVGLLMAS